MLTDNYDKNTYHNHRPKNKNNKMQVSGCKQTIKDLKTDTFFNRLYKV